MCKYQIRKVCIYNHWTLPTRRALSHSRQGIRLHVISSRATPSHRITPRRLYRVNSPRRVNIRRGQSKFVASLGLSMDRRIYLFHYCVGDRAFSVIALRNELSYSLWTATSLEAFKSRKTHLFDR